MKGGKLSKKEKQYQLWVGIGLILVVIVLIAVVIINTVKGEETGNVTINGEAKVTGLVCKDTKLVHPAISNVSANSYLNTVTANFQDDKLSSISLVYEGNYETEQKAVMAMNSAGTEYGLILTKQYGEKEDIFSSNTSVNGVKMQLVQTARDISKINGNTVTYFLLDQGVSMAKSLKGLKNQYEAKGFTCEMSE